jgi:hypothetical protein
VHNLIEARAAKFPLPRLDFGNSTVIASPMSTTSTSLDLDWYAWPAADATLPDIDVFFLSPTMWAGESLGNRWDILSAYLPWYAIWYFSWLLVIPNSIPKPFLVLRSVNSPKRPLCSTEMMDLISSLARCWGVQKRICFLNRCSRPARG